VGFFFTLCHDAFFSLPKKMVQVLWNGQCLEALLQLLSEQSAVADGESQLAFRTSMHQQVREWITHAFLLAPSTTQGLLQVCYWSMSQVS
jgi:hypothetical protein